MTIFIMIIISQVDKVVQYLEVCFHARAREEPCAEWSEVQAR